MSEVRGYRAIQARVLKMKGFYENPMPWLQTLAAESTELIRRDAETGGGVSGPPFKLSPATIEKRRREGRPATPLVDSGFLVRSLSGAVVPGARRGDMRVVLRGAEHPRGGGGTKARTVTFKARGKRPARTKTFAPSAARPFVVLVRLIKAAGINWPRHHPGYMKAKLGEWRAMAAGWTRAAKQFENQVERAA